MRPIPGLLALMTLVHPGCGAEMPLTEYRSHAGAVADSAAEPMAPYGELASARSAMPADAAGMMGMGMGGMMGGAPGQDRGAALPQDAPPVGEEGLQRRIIYDAQIDLRVEELDAAAGQLIDLVQQHRGYVAEQDLSGSPGSKRSGKWKLRVPVDRFESFVAELMSLGELVRNQRTSQDVTEQFYDIEARIRNKKVEEETILKILEERSGKLEDVLKVQVELSRVRGEIEQMQGRLRVLENMSSLATVTINLREREDYAPAAPVVPDFRTRVARAWGASVTDVKTSAENFAVFVSGNALKWLIALLVLIAAFPLLRRLWRRLLRELPRLWEQLRRPIGTPADGPPAPPASPR